MLFIFIMKVENIIEGLNEHIEEKRHKEGIQAKGHLVLHKVIKPHSTFKVYKTYIFTLWFVNGKKKKEVISISHCAKVLEGQEESIIRDINIELCHHIFNWIGSDFYKKIIKGDL